MVIKIIWTLIGINSIALLFFIGLFIASADGRNVDSMEKGWMTIFFVLGFIVIMLAVIPLRVSHSSFSIFVSGFFAALPLLIYAGTLISKKLSSLKKLPPSSEYYYKDKTQRSIARAIEQNDTVLLAELIQGQDLNKEGNQVGDWGGYNYLQFAVHLRRDPVFFPFNDEANRAAIRLLVDKGSATTPALAEAIRYLPIDMVSILLDNGADPNTHRLISKEPLLFDAIGTNKELNDMAILLIRKGANVNAKNYDKQTPLIYGAYNSGTRDVWNDCWRIVLYLLVEAHADYEYTTPSGVNLAWVIKDIRTEAEVKKITMPPDFDNVVAWLKGHHVDTSPANEK
ncbi:MAG: hypothetical protein ABIQ31_03695 [Ferruginibacter sp.]